MELQSTGTSINKVRRGSAVSADFRGQIPMRHSVLEGGVFLLSILHEEMSSGWIAGRADERERLIKVRCMRTHGGKRGQHFPGEDERSY